MNYFVAKLIFQLFTNDKESNQFDEQLRLIDAVSESLALEMAYQIGSMRQEEICNKNEQKIIWKFIAVTEIQHIGDICNGKEIHYKITEPEKTEDYLALIYDKAHHLKTRKTVYQ